MSGRDWSRILADVVAEKTAKALAAVPPPYVSTRDAPMPGLTAIGSPWSRAIFNGPFYVTAPGPDRPACSLVFVQSAEGNTVAPDPSTLGGGVTDQHVIYEGLSRVSADAVLAGARTLYQRALFSVWHPEFVEMRKALGLPRHPTQIVATERGIDLDAALLFNVPDLPVTIVTTSAGAAAMRARLALRPWVHVVIPEGDSGSAGAFRQLRADGVASISCVGGRTLATVLLQERLVDDVYLTTSPTRGGEPNTPLPQPVFDGSVVVEKRGTGQEAGVVFTHLHLSHQR